MLGARRYLCSLALGNGVRMGHITDTIVKNGAHFSNFAQRIKLAYWEKVEKGEALPIKEKDLDTLLLLAYDDVQQFEVPLAKQDQENRSYILAEACKAKGMTFDRFLRAWAMKLTVELSKGKICVWCGRTYEEHTDTEPTMAVPRTPCLLMKAGFIPKDE